MGAAAGPSRAQPGVPPDLSHTNADKHYCLICRGMAWPALLPAPAVVFCSRSCGLGRGVLQIPLPGLLAAPDLMYASGFHDPAWHRQPSVLSLACVSGLLPAPLL